MMVVEISQCSVPLDEMVEKMAELGNSRDLSIRVQREEIFDAMHRV